MLMKAKILNVQDTFFAKFLCHLCTTYVVKLDSNGYMVVALISKMVDLGDFDFVGNTLRGSTVSL